MFCPQCRSEYRAGFTTCAHCHVPLVAELPPADLFESPEAMAKSLEGKETQAILVGSHVDLSEAQSYLGGKRIASVLAGEAGDEPAETPVAHRFFLMVAADDLERAREAIQARWRQGAIAQGLLLSDGPVPEGVCPACGAPVPPTASECPDCGLFLGDADAAAEGQGSDEG